MGGREGRAEGRRVHGRAEHLGEGDDGRDGVGPRRLVADDDGHPADARLDQQVGQLVEAATDGAAFQARRRRHVRLALLGERRHAQRHEHRTGRRAGRIMEGPPHDDAELVDRADLVGPLRDRFRQADQVTREDGVVGEVPLVLLAGGDDDRRPVGPGVGQVADGVAETGRGVHVDEGGPAGGLGVAVGHADHRRLLQRQHELQVGRARSGRR